MEIKQEQITALVDDLITKKENIEGRKGYMQDVPQNYVACAVYSHVIDQLRGIMNGK